MTKQQAIKECELLKQAIIRYSETMNNKHYEDKTPLEREIDNIAGAHHLHLDKMKNFLLKGESEYEVSPAEQLASKMMSASNALRTGSIPVDQGVADEFSDALDYLDIARKHKDRAKTILAKDKLKGMGD